MANEYADRPEGGFQGEMLPGAPASPAPAPPQPIRFERPPWADALERGDLDPALLAPQAPTSDQQLSALERIKLDQGDYNPPPPDLSPPVQLAPIQRFRPPAADWRREEIERAQREREAK